MKGGSHHIAKGPVRRAIEAIIMVTLHGLKLELMLGSTAPVRMLAQGAGCAARETTKTCGAVRAPIWD
ncbi:hypothetical protein AA0311_1866 [Asaia bogorensis NBRC 16594]|nr:hypothetical protein AA0311_1866 [Asaia bogorensis NBRC 16594]